MPVSAGRRPVQFFAVLNQVRPRGGGTLVLTGEPGDVILMHCDCFHAAAPNRGTEPRMMLTGMIAPDHAEQ
jgi:ectoine hydroxylase-related dioxygenase (phytanoyl-CoA dioxygenase family)